ncbi:TRIC cation channel family protein [Neobacillus cucumis]|uniref:trimeric intracellular cation channel family protein n=1 Tax=Neobacillus cucumis TaxID=1740721 RepID=UPI0018DF101E|nr:TRIC cation channel family protein [Neobacillus cucumis]MBI0580011.1 TRIC cation channel family protein [Neobacillus cucumis]
MSWIVLHFIGIISYAATGAFVALEAEYSFIGVYALGLTTSFGGGVIRNLIIGVPVSELWDHSTILTVLTTLTFILIFPLKWLNHWKRRNLFFDSIGLASFALQGAMSAKEVFDNDLGVIILAAMFTGVGGGMIRDILASRKPLALKEEIHAILTILCAICIWLGWSDPLQLSLIVLVVMTLRMTAVRYHWRLHLPCNLKKIRKTQSNLMTPFLGKKSQMGTRFFASEECDAPLSFKEK